MVRASDFSEQNLNVYCPSNFYMTSKPLTPKPKPQTQTLRKHPGLNPKPLFSKAARALWICAEHLEHKASSHSVQM